MKQRHHARLPLSFMVPGTNVVLAEIGTEIDPLQREQLSAYGITENRTVRVLHQKPMTVILADEIEVALEHSITRHIWVERA